MRLSILLVSTAVSFIVSIAALSPTMASEDKKPVVPTELRGEGAVPLCDDGKILKRISKRFKKNNAKHFDSDIEVVEFEEIRETDFLPNPTDRNDRRFCAGHAQLSNGNHPKIFFLIQEREGLASHGWGVEFCIRGHDPLRFYGDKCRSVRKPF